MDNTVQLDTLSPACLQYACSDYMIHVAREPITSLIDIHPVFTENLDLKCFYRVGKFLSMGRPIHKLSASCTPTANFRAKGSAVQQSSFPEEGMSSTTAR